MRVYVDHFGKAPWGWLPSDTRAQRMGDLYRLYAASVRD